MFNQSIANIHLYISIIPQCDAGKLECHNYDCILDKNVKYNSDQAMILIARELSCPCQTSRLWQFINETQKV